MKEAKRQRKLPEPLFRKPDLVPATPENVRAVLEQLAIAPVDALSRLLDEQSAELCGYLAANGIKLEKALPAKPLPGVTYVSVEGGFVGYKARDSHPAVIEAVEALQALRLVRAGKDEANRIIAAVSFGAAYERTRATVAFARPVTASRNQQRARLQIVGQIRLPQELRDAVEKLNKDLLAMFPKSRPRYREIQRLLRSSRRVDVKESTIRYILEGPRATQRKK